MGPEETSLGISHSGERMVWWLWGKVEVRGRRQKATRSAQELKKGKGGGEARREGEGYERRRGERRRPVMERIKTPQKRNPSTK